MPTSLIPPAEMHVLLALGDGAKHGHAIKLEIRQRTSGKVELGPGTLYGAIKRLSERHWIEETGREDRRRYYAMTRNGRRVLREELARLRELLDIAVGKDLIAGG